MQEQNTFTNDEIMTLSEIARYLRVSEKTILRMAQSGEIPGAKVSNQWRFMREVIDDWFTAKMQSAPKQDLIHLIEAEQVIIPLRQLITSERIILNLKPGTKDQILEQLIAPLVSERLITNPALFLRSLLEREAAISTAIGHGIAVPHVRDPEEINISAPCMAIGICREGIHYDSLDGDPTHIFILPCAPSETVHLRIMARLSLMFRSDNILQNFLTASKSDDIIRIIGEADRETAT